MQQHAPKITQLPNNNDHIISIFDKDTEKSYLLEQQALSQNIVTNEIPTKTASSIFKV